MKKTSKLLLFFTFNLSCCLSFASAGDSIFNSSQVHAVKFYFSQSHWYDSLVNYYSIDKKMKGNVLVDGIMYNNVGVQFKGNSSFNNPSKKKSWKIDFNEYDTLQDCHGEKTLNLNNGFKDPTMIREKVALDFCMKNGMPAPRCTYANVYVNDTLWGFYTMVEQVDKTFLKHWFADNDGNLFKGDPNGTLQWWGSSVSSYNTKYELKTNKTQNDWSDLIHLIDKINNTPTANFYDSLETVMNTPDFIRGWAINILFSNLDSYQGSGHNYYVFDDSTYRKFNWITWDVNEAFGNFSQGMSISQMENLSIFYISSPTQNRPLEVNMLANSTYKNNYIWELCSLTANKFDTTKLYPVIDSLANLIRPYVYADPNKFYTNNQFETNLTADITGNPSGIPGLKPFILNRRASVIAELGNNGCFMGVNEFSATGLQFTVSPNPFSENAVLEVSGNQPLVSNAEFKMFDVFGKEVCILPVTGTRSVISRNELPSGIYFYQVNSEKGILGSGKVVIE